MVCLLRPYFNGQAANSQGWPDVIASAQLEVRSNARGEVEALPTTAKATAVKVTTILSPSLPLAGLTG